MLDMLTMLNIVYEAIKKNYNFAYFVDIFTRLFYLHNRDSIINIKKKKFVLFYLFHAILLFLFFFVVFSLILILYACVCVF